MGNSKSCSSFQVRPDRVVATLTGIQVIRALWEVWGCFDNDWPPLFDVLIMPTVYISTILCIFQMVISVCATWSVYKYHLRSLNINWWIYYALTVLGFFDSCANLSVLCIGKDRYVAGCIGDKLANPPPTGCQDCPIVPECVRSWVETVAWGAVITMLTLISNVAFAYALYRVKANHRLTVPQDTFPPPPYPTSRHRADGFDDDGFQIIELK